jgi:hypothetical protein
MKRKIEIEKKYIYVRNSCKKDKKCEFLVELEKGRKGERKKKRKTERKKNRKEERKKKRIDCEKHRRTK